MKKEKTTLKGHASQVFWSAPLLLSPTEIILAWGEFCCCCCYIN